MPFSSHHLENFFEENFPPQSVLKHLINAALDSLSARVLNFLKAPNTSEFFLKIVTHINIEKSSTISKKYVLLLIVNGVIGPQM